MAGRYRLFESETVGKTWGFGGSPRVLASEGGANKHNGVDVGRLGSFRGVCLFRHNGGQRFAESLQVLNDTERGGGQDAILQCDQYDWEGSPRQIDWQHFEA